MFTEPRYRGLAIDIKINKKKCKLPIIFIAGSGCCLGSVTLYKAFPDSRKAPGSGIITDLCRQHRLFHSDR